METKDVWAYLENERRSRLIKGIVFVELEEKIKDRQATKGTDT